MQSRQHLLALSVIVAFCFVLLTVAHPAFATVHNVRNVLLQSSTIGLVAIGMTMVVIIGGIDLSVGAVVALSAVVLGTLCDMGCNGVLASSASLFTGTAIGIGIGLLVTIGRVQPFIASLGIMGVSRGLALAISGGRSTSEVGSFAAYLGGGTILGIPMPICVFVLAGMTAHLLLSQTEFGLRIYAIGSNRRAAWITGIPIDRYFVSAFAMSGFLASLAGLVVAGRLRAAQPIIGNLYELDAIAAVVIGGGSLSGGRGSVLGTIMGVLLLSFIRNAMVLNDLSPYSQQVVLGAILIAAVLVDRRAREFSNADHIEEKRESTDE